MSTHFYQVGKTCDVKCSHVSCKLFKRVAEEFCAECNTPLGEKAKYTIDRGIFFHQACYIGEVPGGNE